MEELKNKIVDAIKEVYDPEIPINVYDLGLIYEINVKNNNDVDVLMTLTSPTCPTADYIKEMVYDAVKSVDDVKSVKVEFTFEPMWTPKRINSEVREELGFFDEEEQDSAVKNVFEKQDEKICFNCGITDEKRPIIECYYNGNKTYICAKCIRKFD